MATANGNARPDEAMVQRLVALIQEGIAAGVEELAPLVNAPLTEQTGDQPACR